MFFNVASAYALLFIILLICCSPLVTSDHEVLPISHTARGLRLPADDPKTELQLLMETHNEDVEVLNPRDGFAVEHLIQRSIVQIPKFMHGILIIVSTGKFVWIGSNNTANQEEVDRLLEGNPYREDPRERDETPVQTLEKTITEWRKYDYLDNSSVLIIGAVTRSDRLKEIDSQVQRLIHSYNSAAPISSRTVPLVAKTASDRTDCALRISELPDLQNKRRIEIYLGVYRYGDEPFLQQDVATKEVAGNMWLPYSLEGAEWRLGDRKPEISES